MENDHSNTGCAHGAAGALPTNPTPYAREDLSPATLARQNEFLKRIEDVGNVTEAAELAAISRDSHYDWISKAKDPDGEYAERYERAREAFRDRIRREVRRRGIEGESRPYIYQGQHVKDAHGNPVYIVEKSDRILELQSRICPELRDKHSHEITGEGGGPVKVVTLRFPAKIASADEWSRVSRAAAEARDSERRKRLDEHVNDQ